MDDEKGLILVSDDEVNEFKIGPSSLFFRRISSAKVSELQAKNRNREGRLNTRQYHEMILRYGIVGWRGIQLKPGVPFPDAQPGSDLNKDQLGELVMRLPGAVIDDRDGREGLITRMTADVVEAEQGLLGNS